MHGRKPHGGDIEDDLVYHGARKNVGSATGATPNATETMANPVKTIEAHKPKAISSEFWRSCIVMADIKLLARTGIISVSNSILRTMLCRRIGSIGFDKAPADICHAAVKMHHSFE